MDMEDNVESTQLTTKPAAALKAFEFEGAEIRAMEIDGEAWFVAADVAKGLGYTNPLKAIRDHCKGVNETFLPTAVVRKK